MDLGAELKGKVGPFPLYVWLLIMTGLGLVAYLVLGKKKKGAATGTPGTPCTQSDGSAGTWDSTGTVCQATTVSTVNTPVAATTATAAQPASGMRNWRSQSAGPTVAATPPSTTSTSSTVPPPATTVSTTTPPTTAATTLVTVPNLAGMSAGAAHNSIVALGLVPKAPAGQKANMKVSYTNPGFGAKVAPGSSVLIETSGYVSS